MTTTHRPVVDDGYRRSVPQHKGRGQAALEDVMTYATGATPPAMSSRRIRAMQFGDVIGRR